MIVKLDVKLGYFPEEGTNLELELQAENINVLFLFIFYHERFYHVVGKKNNKKTHQYFSA